MSNNEKLLEMILENEIDGINEIKALVENGADVNTRNDDGETPLILATENENLDVMRFLIRNGSDVNARKNDGKTPLIVASMIENADDVIMLLIESGADVNAKDNEGNTPITMTSSDGDLNLSKILVNNGANVNARTNDGATPLMLASAFNDTFELMKLLIENGADISGIEFNGEILEFIESRKNPNEECKKIRDELKTFKQENKILRESLTDIVDKLKVCNSRSINTNVIRDIPGMSSFPDMSIFISDKISKMRANDALMNEEVNVGDFLNDDKNNIVFVVDGFATIISKENMNLEDPTSIFYECIRVNSFSRENTTGPKLFALRKIGGNGLVWLEDVKKIKEDSTKNAFVLEKVKSIETIVSMDVLDNNRIVSGTHCQPGLNDIVYKLSFGIHVD